MSHRLLASNQKLIDAARDASERARLLQDRAILLARLGRAEQAREPLPEGHAPHSQVTHPGRWAALAQTELQTGYMMLVRAIAQPTTF